MPIATANCVPDAETFSDSDLQDLTSFFDGDELSYQFLRDFLHPDDQTSDPSKTFIDIDTAVVTEDQSSTFNSLAPSTNFQPCQVEDISLTCLQPTTTIQHSDCSSFTHPNLHNDASSSSNDVNTSSKNVNFDRSMFKWVSKHPRLWSTDDVLDWLYSSVENEGVDLSRLRGEAFQDVNGIQLCSMTYQDFVNKEPEYGGLLFKCFQKRTESTTTVPSANRPSLESEQKDNDKTTGSLSTTNSILFEPHMAVISATFHPGWSETIPGIQHIHQNQQPIQTVTNSIVINTNKGSSLPLPASGPYRYPRAIAPPAFKPKRRPGRPRTRNLLSDAEIEREKEKKRIKKQHLWEFLYDVLKNPGYNPRLVKWENEVEGIFRIVQSEMMAHVWGNRKNNENMNYEKLSRAMRHYYRRGILERMEGRRLVYKFSKTAIDKLKSRPSMT